MTMPIAHADIYTDFQGLAELRASAKEDGQAALREVAGQFEAMFIQMMLKSMRDANLGEGLMDSDHVKTYQSMFDQQIALDLSKGKGLGLADMMVQQLGRNYEAQDDAGAMGADAVAAPVSPQQQAMIQSMRKPPVQAEAVDKSATAIQRPKDDWKPNTPEAFVQQLWPHAKRAAGELGTRPEVLISQAALETGWGKHTIRGVDGSNSFNLFGIKADTRWQGERAVTETVEFRDGLMRKERATFRAYESLADSFKDYVQFIKSNPRYQEALNKAADAPAYTRALSEAGYATDPDYSGKINRIMDSQRLREAVSGIKEITREPIS